MMLSLTESIHCIMCEKQTFSVDFSPQFSIEALKDLERLGHLERHFIFPLNQDHYLPSWAQIQILTSLCMPIIQDLYCLYPICVLNWPKHQVP